MNAYLVTCRNDTRKKSFELIVIASNPGEAEAKALKAMRDWYYSYDYCSNIKMLAAEGQYGHPKPLLLP